MHVPPTRYLNENLSAGIVLLKCRVDQYILYILVFNKFIKQ